MPLETTLTGTTKDGTEITATDNSFNSLIHLPLMYQSETDEKYI